MSHIATVEIEIRDLDALKAACARLGLEFRQGQQQYKWFGRSVGNYPLPAGFTAAELGSCEHAIGIPGNKRAYELGVVARRDGRPGYVLMWDFYMGGYGLEAVVGKDCNALRQAYATEVAKRKAIQQGFRVQERKLSNGSVQLVCSK